MGDEAAGQRRRLIDWPSLAMALLPLIAIGVDASGIVYYRQGLRNEPMDFAASVVAVALVLSIAIAGLGFRAWTLTRRSDARATFCWLLVPLVLMVWPALCAMRPRPIEDYRRGLAGWARANVDRQRMRAWHETMTPVSSRAKVWDHELPRYVVKLHTSAIEQHPNGLLLQWGTRATMPGRERKVFIAIDDATQPPDEGRRFWRAAAPGVFVGTHGPP